MYSKPSWQPFYAIHVTALYTRGDLGTFGILSQQSLLCIAVESICSGTLIDWIQKWALNFRESILCRPLVLLLPIPVSIRVSSNESTLRMRWPKYWSFSFSTIPSEEHPGLISFRMDWLDLLAVHGTLSSSTPQFKSINSSVLSLLHSPTLTSIHDHWKNHSLD